jgi:hypothetical protein
MKVFVSKQNWLPTKTIRGSLSGDLITEYSDWRTVSGLRVPFQTKITNNNMVQSMKIERGVSIDSPNDKPYCKPKTNRATTSYTKTNGKLECLRVRTGHLLVRPKINGKDFGWFIFDSGAGAMVINKSVADDLKLETIGKIQVVGMGGSGESQFRKVSEFSLGEVTMKDSPFLELDLDQIAKLLGVKLGGIVGRDLFYKSVVEIDGPGSQISVYNPSAYRLRGDWSPVKIDHGMPAIEATFDRGQGWFGVDSGGDEVVLFNAPAVEKFDLLKGRDLADSKIGGYGGLATVKMGTIDWFRIGRVMLDKPIAKFAVGKTGVLSNRYLTGDIGQALLKQFIVVFDLSNERMAFIKP